MKEIITTKLNLEIKKELKKILDKLECGLDEHRLNTLINIQDKYQINIKYIKKNDSIIAFCIYSNIIKNQLMQDLGESCDHYDDETYEYFKKLIKDMRDETIYIHYIESIVKENNYGTQLLESVVDLDQDIILYSTIEAETYWRKNNFENIFGYEYMYYA